MGPISARYVSPCIEKMAGSDNSHTTSDWQDNIPRALDVIGGIKSSISRHVEDGLKLDTIFFLNKTHFFSPLVLARQLVLNLINDSCKNLSNQTDIVFKYDCYNKQDLKKIMLIVMFLLLKPFNYWELTQAQTDQPAFPVCLFSYSKTGRRESVKKSHVSYCNLVLCKQIILVFGILKFLMITEHIWVVKSSG